MSDSNEKNDFFYIHRYTFMSDIQLDVICNFAEAYIHQRIPLLCKNYLAEMT